VDRSWRLVFVPQSSVTEISGEPECFPFTPFIVKRQPSWQLLGHAKDIVGHPDIALSTVAMVVVSDYFHHTPYVRNNCLIGSTW
jgi:hypothetical protein